MGAAAKAAMAAAGKPGAKNPAGVGFYQGNTAGFSPTNTAYNKFWMKKYGSFGKVFDPKTRTWIAANGASEWAEDGRVIVKDDNKPHPDLKARYDALKGGVSSPAPAPAPPSAPAPAPPSAPAPSPAPGPPGSPTSNDDITLSGTGQPNQKWDPTPWDPYSTGTPIATTPPPTTGGGLMAGPTTGGGLLAGPTTKPYEAAKAIYTDSTGLQKPRTGPAGGASMGGSTLGGMAPQGAQRPQVATTGVADGPMGRPSSAPIAGLPQMPQNQAIKPAQPQTPPTAGRPENAAPAAPVGPDPRQMYGEQVAKARAAYGAWPMADDPKSPQPKFTPGKSFYNAFTGMWGRA